MPARSASERSELALSSLGSTMSRSRPVFESHAQRQTGSLPLFDRAKNTVEWSGLIRRSRGSPREKRRVRAYWRGKSRWCRSTHPQRSPLRRHPRRHPRQHGEHRAVRSGPIDEGSLIDNGHSSSVIAVDNDVDNRSSDSNC